MQFCVYFSGGTVPIACDLEQREGKKQHMDTCSNYILKTEVERRGMVCFMGTVIAWEGFWIIRVDFLGKKDQ